MYRWWSELVELEWPRLRNAVAAKGAAILSRHERDEALVVAGDRMTRLVVWNFTGTTAGEFVNCVMTVALRACQDVQRKAATYGAHLTSLHATDAETGDPAPYIARAEARHAFDQAAEEEDDEDVRELYATGRDFLEWALPRLTPQPRAVLELLIATPPRTPSEIMEKLDMSRASVDTNKKRAIEQLRALKEEYGS